MKRPHRTTSDIVDVRPAKRENAARYTEVVGPVPEMTEERRWDALRAVTYSHARSPIEPFDGGSPLSGVLEVMEMLGLLGVEKRTEERLEPVERSTILAAVDHPDRRVRCPTCNALPGAACTTYTRYDVRPKVYQRGHIERHRRAEEQH